MDTERNEQDLERLAAEIRKLGDPYVSPEPSQQYWANFRTRAMERISEKESRTSSAIFDRAKEWIAGHLLGSGLIGAALAAAVALAVINPFQTSQVKRETAQATHTPVVVSPMPAPKVAAPVETVTTSPETLRVGRAVQHDKWLASNLNAKKVGRLSQMAMADGHDADAYRASSEDHDRRVESRVEESVGQPMLMGSEEDYPVSLNELSAPELESVLRDMQKH